MMGTVLLFSIFLCPSLLFLADVWKIHLLNGFVLILPDTLIFCRDKILSGVFMIVIVAIPFGSIFLPQYQCLIYFFLWKA